MRILVATVQVPFVRGGAEALAEGLLSALHAEGHEAELVSVPFDWSQVDRVPDQMLACRLLEVAESNGVPVDRLIGLKYPAYLIPHPNKVLWLLHQHRAAYDLWEHPLNDLRHSPRALAVRDLIRDADRRLIPDAKGVYTISATVSDRLWRYCGIESTPLYHPPPDAGRFYSAEPEDYLFYPSRLVATKRQILVVEALAETKQPVRVVFAGRSATPSYEESLRYRGYKLGVGDRIEWRGAVTQDEKLDLYARSLAVVFPPIDEDYGYITLEAMLASRGVITCTDSGGSLELIEHGKSGFVTEPTTQALAQAMDELWADRQLCRRLGAAARERYQALDISWKTVVDRLLA